MEKYSVFDCTIVELDKHHSDRKGNITVVENGKTTTLRTIGDKWSYLQRSKFGANAQPFYVPLDNEGNPLSHSYSFDEDVDRFVDYLQGGLKAYKKN